MDNQTIDTSNLDVSKLTDRDKQELQQFIVNETQKARIQQCTHPFLQCFPSPNHIMTLPQLPSLGAFGENSRTTFEHVSGAGPLNCSNAVMKLIASKVMRS